MDTPGERRGRGGEDQAALCVRPVEICEIETGRMSIKYRISKCKYMSNVKNFKIQYQNNQD